jgi:hypothetical protein
VLTLVVAASVGSIRESYGFDVYWLPAGSSDWNNGNNWSDAVGGFPRGSVPSADFEEVAVINTGGTATLTSAAGDVVGGVVLGASPTDVGTLSISSGGSLTSAVSSTTNGNVAVGDFGVGVLNVSGTGSLTAPTLSVGGLAGSQASLSGSAVVTVSGSTTVSRGLRLTGPGVNFSSASGVLLQSNAVLTSEITSAASHSPIKTAGTLSLGGTLNVQFSGVTPSVGNVWNIGDAAAITGSFANASVGGAISVAGVPAPSVGSAYRLRTANGGTNGKLLQVALESMLVLRVNRDTGEISIRNPAGAPVTNLDGYSISSPRGSLLSSYKGISGAPAGDSGWEKAPMNSTTGLGELKPSGVLNVSSAATNLSLGTGFSKTAVASQGLGASGEDLTFSYHALGGAVTTGQIEYVGTPFLNNIVLSVNTVTGLATLKNDSLQSLSLDGYSILSSTGALNGASWTGLGGTFANWNKSPAATSALSETNPVAPSTLTAGQSVSLGTIGNFSTQAAQNGLSMKFILGNESSFRLASVTFTSTVGVSGDFDGNGRVDGNDLLVWQRGGSPNPNSPGDLATWKANFAANYSTPASSAATAAVPEPTAGFLALAGLAGATYRRKSISQSLAGFRRSLMTRRVVALAAMTLALFSATTSQAAVTITYDVAQPTLGAFDQAQVLDDAMVPGGTAPGGGTYNSQAFIDNGGPPGQTFTAPAAKHLYALTAVYVKGVGDSGGGVFDLGTTWSLRISAVSGTNLTPLKTHLGVAAPLGPTGSEWFKFSLTGSDAPMLLPNVQYAFEIYSSTGWFGIDATQGDAAYAGGTAFNSNSNSREFTNNTLGNVANHGYDRTFVAQLAAPPGGPGDVNNSGAADGADYNIIKMNLETAQPIFTNGDLDGNSYVDLNDFRRWRSAAPPAVLASVGLPEPSTASLAGAALLAMASRRRRSAKRSSPREATSSGTAPRAGAGGLGAIVTAVSIVLASSTLASAQTLGFNFASTDPDSATSSLAFSDVAGVIPVAHWNNLVGNSGSGVSGLVYDSGGSSLSSTASVTWSSPNTWRSGGNNAFPAGPDHVLLSGYLDTGNASNNGATITITGIDAAIRANAYDVYVYLLSDSSNDRGGGYRVSDGSTNILKYGSTMGSPATYVEDPGTDVDNSLDGNYLRFRGFTGSSLTITSDTTLTSPNGFRAPINAVQIVSVNIGPGDVNEDGFTTLADYSIIKSNFFKTSGVTRMTGDLNVDGRVDLFDYALWRNNAPPSVIATLEVPEPASATLAAASCCVLSRFARRRREQACG